MAKRKFDPVHPGVVLAEDFLKGLEISQYRLSAASPNGTTMRSISCCIATHRSPNAPFHSAICSELSAAIDRSHNHWDGLSSLATNSRGGGRWRTKGRRI